MSSPTALPMRACLVGYADRTSAMRRSSGGVSRSRPVRTAMPATRAEPAVGHLHDAGLRIGGGGTGFGLAAVAPLDLLQLGQPIQCLLHALFHLAPGSLLRGRLAPAVLGRVGVELVLQLTHPRARHLQVVLQAERALVLQPCAVRLARAGVARRLRVAVPIHGLGRRSAIAVGVHAVGEGLGLADGEGAVADAVEGDAGDVGGRQVGRRRVGRGEVGQGRHGHSLPVGRLTAGRCAGSRGRRAAARAWSG